MLWEKSIFALVELGHKIKLLFTVLFFVFELLLNAEGRASFRLINCEERSQRYNFFFLKLVILRFITIFINTLIKINN